MTPGNSPDTVSETVQEFYDDVGWRDDGSKTTDELLWEDSRSAATDYVSRCRLRVLKYIPEGGQRILDAASGPIQYPEYALYSEKFDQRYCVDLSSLALEKAKERLGDHAVCVQGNIVDLDLPINYFDCTVSLHTIYHIAAEQQERAVRNLLRMTRPGMPVVIVYSNPDSLFGYFSKLLNTFRKARPKELYFQPKPLKWWSRFKDQATVVIVPWRFLAAADSKKLIPDNALGKRMLELIFRWEESHQRSAARWGRYPMIILTKKTEPN